jgi:hypothetical protein
MTRETEEMKEMKAKIDRIKIEHSVYSKPFRADHDI